MTGHLSDAVAKGAIAQDLVARALAAAEPGERLHWTGRGTSWATFVALAPMLLLPTLFLGPFLFIALAGGGEWRYRRAPAWFPDVVPAWLAAAVMLGFVAAALIWYFIGVINAVVSAPKTLFMITGRRFVVQSGRSTWSVPLGAIEQVKAHGAGHRTRLTFRMARLQGQRRASPKTLFGVRNADAALEALNRLGIAACDRRDASPAEGPPGLAPGEVLRWSGRRGLGGIGKDRLIMMALCLPLPLPFFVSIWWVWADILAGGRADGSWDIAWAIGTTAVLGCTLGPMAWFPLRAAPAFLDDIVVDAFGTLGVTDRRIVFFHPLTGSIDREIAAGRIADAFVVEQDERGRGQIALSVETEGGADTKPMDLHGVPDVGGAASKMRRLIANPS